MKYNVDVVVPNNYAPATAWKKFTLRATSLEMANDIAAKAKECGMVACIVEVDD